MHLLVVALETRLQVAHFAPPLVAQFEQLRAHHSQRLDDLAVERVRRLARRALAAAAAPRRAPPHAFHPLPVEVCAGERLVRATRVAASLPLALCVLLALCVALTVGRRLLDGRRVGVAACLNLLLELRAQNAAAPRFGSGRRLAVEHRLRGPSRLQRRVLVVAATAVLRRRLCAYTRASLHVAADRRDGRRVRTQLIYRAFRIDLPLAADADAGVWARADPDAEEAAVIVRTPVAAARSEGRVPIVADAPEASEQLSHRVVRLELRDVARRAARARQIAALCD